MSDATVTLPVSLTIKNVSVTKAEIETAMLHDDEKVMLIDCGAVDRVDALGMQLLLATQLELGRSDRKLMLSEQNECIDHAALILGLSFPVADIHPVAPDA